MSSLDVESIVTGLRAARRETIMAWCPSLDGQGLADHLMTALLEVELAIVALEKHERRAPVVPDDPIPYSVTANDDEPSVGDVSEAERSDIRGMVAASQGRPSP